MKILAVVARVGENTNAGEIINKEITKFSSFLQDISCIEMFKNADLDFLVLAQAEKCPDTVCAREDASFYHGVLPEDVDDTSIIKFLKQWQKQKNYDYIFFGSSVYERNLAFRFAADEGKKLLTNISGIVFRDEMARWYRDIFLGNLTEEVPVDKEVVITLASNAGAEFNMQYCPKWKKEIIQAQKASFIVKNLRKKKEISSGWESVDRIIVIGNGVDKTGFPLVKQFAQKMQAEIAGTRRAVENGLLPVERMIGISGKSISPKLCIVIGASGLAAFVKGIEKSDTIVSVNSDEDALIFKYSDYGIVKNYQDFLETLMEADPEKRIKI